MEGLSGNHNYVVQGGLIYSFVLFIFSELMFFIRIFWVFFDAAASPSIELGCVWPPYGITPPNFLGVPLLGTVILLGRGVTVSWSHAQLLANVKASTTLGLTVCLSLAFLSLQLYEY
jgi:cytochrome c oxidase subunit 3